MMGVLESYHNLVTPTKCDPYIGTYDNLSVWWYITEICGRLDTKCFAYQYIWFFLNYIIFFNNANHQLRQSRLIKAD